MVRHQAVFAAFAALLLGAAAPAQAAGNPATAALPAVSETPADIATFHKVNVTLVHAIDKAEQYGGGKPISVKFDANGGRPVFVAEVYHNDTLWIGRLDAKTDLLVGSATTRRLQLSKPALLVLTDARMTLSQAVGRAEQLFAGPAIDARLTKLGGNLVYAVGIIKNGAIEPAIVDPMSPHADTGPARSGVPRSERSK